MSMIDNFISQLLQSKKSFSDLSIKEGQNIWVRASGALLCSNSGVVRREDIIEFMKTHQAVTGHRSDKLKEDLAQTGDLDFALSTGGRRMRGNIYQADGKMLCIAMRLMSETVPPLETIGVPPAFFGCLKQSKGLLLVTGATGSGKTTTLAAGLEHLNENREGHIITLEDPVEYLLNSKKCFIDQRQIKRDVPSFSHGLRSALRQDPDIILVGELRDYDTVKIAMDAANTGHLVLGTLHTNSARQTVERITSFFSEDKQIWALNTLAQVLVGIASQVLVPRADGNGRVMCSELMVGTPDIKNSIREGKNAQLFSAMDTGKANGHVLLNRSLRQMVLKGEITKEAALYATYDPNDLAKELRDVE